MKPEMQPHRRDAAQPPRRRSGFRHLGVLLTVLAVWAIAAYLVVPMIWKVYFRHHPSLEGADRFTRTADGHPGDPINIAIVGTKSQLIEAMTAAKWYPASPITLRSSVRIAVDSVFQRPDDRAPVSGLFLFGRKQDLAFEQPVGSSPRQRHHVRFWRSKASEDDRPLWLGAATFDRSVGLSYTTGEITHHIGPDVDAERDRIALELEQADWVQETYWHNHFHERLRGRNGGGDPWWTDGRLVVVVLRDKDAP